MTCGQTDDEFRSDVRKFVERKLPPDIKAVVTAHRLMSREQARRWQRELNKAGWGAPHWPAEFGGTDWPFVKRAVLQEELLLAGAPSTESLGLATIGPTIIRYGTSDQQSRFLPRIINFDDYWAQAYSEPDAGSDLASLKCSARRQGDHYVVNGTKIWQSHGHWADWAFTLVRTQGGGRKQEGISILLIDLCGPGVTVHPIKFMNGTLFHSQLFFDDVRVPVTNRIGDEGAGWTIAKDLLVTERLFTGRVPECKRELAQLKLLCAGRGPGGTDLCAHPPFARRIAEIEIRLQAFAGVWWKAVERVQIGEELGAEVLKLKLTGAVLLQEIYGLQLEATGPDGLLVDAGSLADDGAPVTPPLSAGYAENVHIHHFRYRGITLGTGSAEVQRDLVAREVFAQGDLGARMAETENERLLNEAVSRFLADQYSWENRRRIVAGGDASGIWKGIAELGIFGLLVPPEAGGYGGSARDLAVLCESFGSALVVDPYVWTTVAGARAATAFPAASEAAGLSLTRMVSGDQRVALAHLEESARFDPWRCQTIAKRTASGWLLTGRKILVWGAEGANKIIVSARIDGAQGEPALFCVGSEALQSQRHLKAYNDRKVSTLSFDGLALAESASLASGASAEALLLEILDMATLALCAETVGAMSEALQITIEYMKTRQQFGRSISEFQVLRHRVVDHCLALHNARSLVRIAAHAFGRGHGAEAKKAVSGAKWMIGRAARQVGHDVLQLHGAIGFQDETPISHYAKFLVSMDAVLGDGEQHITRYLHMN